MTTKEVTKILWTAQVLLGLFLLVAGQNGSGTAQENATTQEPILTPYLVLANRDTIYRVNLDKTRFHPLANRSSVINNTVAIDYDIRRDYLFWADTSQKTIVMANLNGTQPRVIANHGLDAEDLAWDWVNEKLYWTDIHHREIEVLDVATGERKTVIRTGAFSRPRGIIVDPLTRYLYWTDWGVPAKIERASMDGSLRETLHNTDLHYPNDITIDYQSQTIYWVDKTQHKIESSHVDGSNRRTLWHDDLPNPFSMTYYNGVLYWSDWTLNSVLYIPVSNASMVDSLVSSLEKDPMGVRVIAMDAQPTSSPSPCLVNNGGCSHLCLLSAASPSNFSCECPVGLRLADNNRDCVQEPTPIPTPIPGSCIAAGYTECCVLDTDRGVYCEGSTFDCTCDKSCVEYEDCCPDFHLICSLDDSVTTTTAPQNTSSPVSMENLPPTTAEIPHTKSPKDGHVSPQPDNTMHLASSTLQPSPTTSSSVMIAASGVAGHQSEGTVSVLVQPSPPPGASGRAPSQPSGQVQNSPTQQGQKELENYWFGGSKKVVLVGGIVGAVGILLILFAVSTLVYFVVRRRKPGPVATYETFDSAPKLKRVGENSGNEADFTSKV